MNYDGLQDSNLDGTQNYGTEGQVNGHSKIDSMVLDSVNNTRLDQAPDQVRRQEERQKLKNIKEMIQSLKN